MVSGHLVCSVLCRGLAKPSSKMSWASWSYGMLRGLHAPHSEGSMRSSQRK